MKRFSAAALALISALIFICALSPHAPEPATNRGNARTEAHRLRALSQLPVTRATAQPKPTPKPKIMATEIPQIPRGESKQAALTGTTTQIPGGGFKCSERPDWFIRNSDDNYRPDSTNSKGWIVSGNAVTPPSDVPLGNYYLYLPTGQPFGAFAPDYCASAGDVYQFEVVCLTLSLDLTENGDGTYTATATPHGGTAPITYAWTLPANATGVSGTGNTRTFKSDGGDVTVTATDADSANPCTATATQHICALAADLRLNGGGSDGADHAGFNANITASQGTAPYHVVWQFPPDATVVFQEDFSTNNYATTSFNVPMGRENRTVTLSSVVSDSANPSCAKTFSQSLTLADPYEPPTCPAGQHDDGTGVCVADNPNGPQPCATGYSWNGSACVPDTPTDPPTDPPQCPEGQEWNGYQCVPITPPVDPSPCTVDAILTVDNKGGGLYRISADATGVNNPPAVFAWTRDGAALASTASFIEATIAKNASALFQCTIDDANCRIIRTVRVQNEDGGGGGDGGGDGGGGGGPTTPVDPNAVPSVPLAPTVAKDCEGDKIIVTAPAKPPGATSLEIARDDASETVIATATFDDENAGNAPRKYRARALNKNGASDWGPWSDGVALVSDALQIEWIAPGEGASIARAVWLRFALVDSGESVDACGNASLPAGACASLDADDAQIELYLGDYRLSIEVVRVSGSPRNGNYAAFFEPRDYLNAPRDLRVRARGSDCCFAHLARPVTVANSLYGSVFYRDVARFAAPGGMLVPRASVGVEAWPVDENRRFNYWVQHAVRSGTDLDGPYRHEDWDRHQPILLQRGETHEAGGQRIARAQYDAAVTFNLPHQNEVRLRQKWTAQWVLAAFVTGTARVAKLRQVEPGRHLVWGTDPARAFIYDGQLTPIFEGAEHAAADALDAALLGDKLFVVRPGELFAYDTDAGQEAMNYSVRGETRAPRWVEVIGGRAVALYVDAAQNPATRCYDLSFGAPQLLWELEAAATFCAPVASAPSEGGGPGGGPGGGMGSGQSRGLVIGCGAQLWASTDGAAAPALARTFGAAVTAVSSEFIGLANGEVWSRAGTDYARALTLDGAVGGVASWNGGTRGEISGERPARGVAGGPGPWLSAQRQNRSWFDEIELALPLELAGQAVDGVSALELFALELPSLASPDDPQASRQRDERLLIGTREGGVLFVYERSALSQAQGALGATFTAAPRLLPYPMRAQN